MSPLGNEISRISSTAAYFREKFLFSRILQKAKFLAGKLLKIGG
jgi:hypothetical protein